ncbi:hypothetical protein PRZ48_008596 [Zasmidium cellare]|uniref:Uncharacterized protein n=1 Tax=Zasmidium cellare TaxID=395010 RepID=A0ABR0EFY2_ZASCE|nr:hypothetical protein PRZ48_008596 [Zasmidium cellare]
MAIIRDQIARMKDSRPTPVASTKVDARHFYARKATATVTTPGEAMSKEQVEEYRRRFDAARSFEDDEDDWWPEDTNSARPSHGTPTSLTSPHRASPHSNNQASPYSNSPSRVSTLRSNANIFSPKTVPDQNTHTSSPLASGSQLKPTASRWIYPIQDASPTGHVRHGIPTTDASHLTQGANLAVKDLDGMSVQEEGQTRPSAAEARERALIARQIKALARARRAAMQEEEAEQRMTEAGTGEGDDDVDESQARMDEKMP